MSTIFLFVAENIIPPPPLPFNCQVSFDTEQWFFFPRREYQKLISRFRIQELEIYGFCSYTESTTHWYKWIHFLMFDNLAVQNYFLFYPLYRVLFQLGFHTRCVWNRDSLLIAYQSVSPWLTHDKSHTHTHTHTHTHKHIHRQTHTQSDTITHTLTHWLTDSLIHSHTRQVHEPVMMAALVYPIKSLTFLQKAP